MLPANFTSAKVGCFADSMVAFVFAIRLAAWTRGVFVRILHPSIQAFDFSLTIADVGGGMLQVLSMAGMMVYDQRSVTSLGINQSRQEGNATNDPDHSSCYVSLADVAV